MRHHFRASKHLPLRSELAEILKFQALMMHHEYNACVELVVVMVMRERNPGWWWEQKLSGVPRDHFEVEPRKARRAERRSGGAGSGSASSEGKTAKVVGLKNFRLR